MAAGALPDLRSGLGAGIALTGCGVDVIGDFCRVAAGALPDLRSRLGAGIALTGCGLEAVRDFVGWRLTRSAARIGGWNCSDGLRA